MVDHYEEDNDGALLDQLQRKQDNVILKKYHENTSNQ